MNAGLLDFYSDFLILNDRYATATSLSAMTGHVVNHDKITRFLSQEEFDDGLLWKLVKPPLRKVEQEEGVLIGDDSFSEKPHMDENGTVGWHCDHSKGRSVKGINVMSVLYEVNGVSIPLSMRIVRKAEDGKSVQGKNEMFREAIQQAMRNRVKFRYVLADIWYGGSENMEFIKKTHKNGFYFPPQSQPAGGPERGAAPPQAARTDQFAQPKAGRPFECLFKGCGLFRSAH